MIRPVGPAARRLARLAAPMRPHHPPRYVELPLQEVPQEIAALFPMTGWYWRPELAEPPEYLGASTITAAIKLMKLVEDLEAADGLDDEPSLPNLHASGANALAPEPPE